jgi:WD40 repeat protein
MGSDLFCYRGYGATVTCLKFSEDGYRLAGGLLNGTALVWDVEPAIRSRKGKTTDLTGEGLEQLWTDLRPHKSRVPGVRPFSHRIPGAAPSPGDTSSRSGTRRRGSRR